MTVRAAKTWIPCGTQKCTCGTKHTPGCGKRPAVLPMSALSSFIPLYLNLGFSGSKLTGNKKVCNWMRSAKGRNGRAPRPVEPSNSKMLVDMHHRLHTAKSRRPSSTIHKANKHKLQDARQISKRDKSQATEDWVLAAAITAQGKTHKANNTSPQVYGTT